MANIIVAPHRWPYKPPVGSTVDFDHPQVQGAKLLHLLNDGNLTTPSLGAPRNLLDSSPAGLATVTGAPTWQAVDGKQFGGIGRGGYSTGAYDDVTPQVHVFGVIYPAWMVACLVNTDTSSTVPVSSRSASGTPGVRLAYNALGIGTVDVYASDNAAHSMRPSATVPCNDGKPHIFGLVLRSPTQLDLIWDGLVTASSSVATLGAMTIDQYTLGVNRTGTVTNAFLGQILWHMAGNGSVPDFAWLAREPFAMIRPPQSRITYVYGSSVTYQPHFLSLLGVGS